jgi:hypothetical protein
MPTTAFLSFAAAIPALGALRSAIASFADHIGARVIAGAGDSRQSDRPAAQIRLGHAEIMARVAEHLLRDSARKCVDLAATVPVRDADRIALRGQSSFAVDLCLKGVRLLGDAAGSSAQNLDHPLQRAARDVAVIASHVSFDLDTTAELVGRGLLGLPPNTALY